MHRIPSVWITASAGTGKTHQVVSRIISLLARLQPYQKVLCITYTRAAALEMSSRIGMTLSRYDSMDDYQLSIQIKSNNLAATVPMIRELCLRMQLVIERNLIVDTVHGYCLHLLHKYHTYANLSENFSVIDDNQDYQFKHDAISKAIYEASPDCTAITLLSYQQIYDHMSSIIDHRFEVYGFHPEERSELAQKLVTTKLQQSESNNQGCYHDTHVKEFLKDSKHNCAVKLKNFLTLSADEQHALRMEYHSLLKLSCKHHPGIETEYTRISEHLESHARSTTASLSQDMIKLTAVACTHYDALKKRNDALCFSDILHIALYTLTNSCNAFDIRYDITTYTSHIVIDEAQDLSKSQWKIIEILADDILSYDASNTISVVGDPKQSIYSFHGAAPELFEKMKHFFARKAEISGNLRSMTLDLSYRSPPVVLNAIDQVFNNNGKPLLHGTHVHHNSSKQNDSDSGVFIYPFLSTKSGGKNDLGTIVSSITCKIEKWLSEKKYIHGRNSEIKPEDIMILFRTRQPLMSKISDHLRKQKIPVVSNEKSHLTDNEIVQWLSDAGSIAVMQNDLNTTTRWLSLLGLTQANHTPPTNHHNNSCTWDSVCNHELNNMHMHYAKSKGSLNEFYKRIILDYEPRLEAQYPSITRHAVDEFTSLLMKYSTYNSDTLVPFLRWIHNIPPTITTTEQQNGSILITTIHGAKGLQAPIVFVVDDCNFPISDSILYDDLNENELGIIPFVHIKDLKCRYTQLLSDKRSAKMRQEYYRLLYVALTRSENEIHFYGYSSRTKPMSGTWFDVISSTLKDSPCASFETWGNDDLQLLQKQ